MQRPFRRLLLVVLSFSSPAAVRFLAAVGQGHGLKGSARMAGIDKEVGYRFLRDRYLELRRGGLSTGDAVDALGFCSSRVPGWEAMVDRDDRHHLRVDPSREQIFWAAFESGAGSGAASNEAGVSRSTGDRWIQRRFDELRASGVSLARSARGLRLTPERAEVLERDRLATERRKQGAATAAHRDALHASAGLVDAMLGETEASKRRRERADRYWQLMREGVSNVDACRLLGMSRPVGTLIRKQNNFLIPSLTVPRSTRPVPDGAGAGADRRLAAVGVLDAPDRPTTRPAPVDDQPGTAPAHRPGRELPAPHRRP